MKTRCSYCTLWLPTLLTSIATILSFLAMYFFLHFNINAMIKAHEHSAELTKNIEKMISSTLNATFLENDEVFLRAVNLSNRIYDEMVELKKSSSYDTSSLMESYKQLYKILISAVSYSKENRLEDAKNALEEVSIYTLHLGKQTEKLNNYFMEQEENAEKAFALLIVILALTLLSVALFNGLYLIPKRVIRPLEEFGEKLQKNEEKYRIVANWTYDWEYWVGKEKEIIFMTPSVERITGYTAQQFINSPSLLTTIIHPDDMSLWMQHVKEAHLPNRPEEDAQGVEFRVITKDGHVVNIDHICRPVYNENKEFLGVRVANRDVTVKMSILNELKEKNILLDTLATTDELSGLYNRRYFNEAFEREIERVKRMRTTLSIIMCDIDYFKYYNDTYGHQMGDGVIQKVSAVLKSSFSRKMDIVARYGGEEFVILLPSTPPEEIKRLVEKARIGVVALGIEHKDSKTAPFVTMSFGIINCLPDASLHPDKLLKIADDSLYESKRKGRNCATFVEC
ncbi:MAG: diguanylate cyclase [Sulfurimonas sp.]|uniref:GGDEF domain-containing protein n=1 Tax=Sulfurimonas sp. TaxID=2022749 RepID=UPI002627FFC0|nr:diguanylate cyclase [Sulfurimonas sp.]MDD2651630.1 diguanylate cyclase [Sulfurimonas sp.]MDD3451441.1 diguanylate cyclase [Sulfurimonas sp.]